MKLTGIMAMSCKISIDKKCNKFLQKMAKSTKREYVKIFNFIYNDLSTVPNPCMLPNARHLSGFSDNRYRWKLGDYRIIGIVENGEFCIIKIIKIAKRDDNTYKGL